MKLCVIRLAMGTALFGVFLSTAPTFSQTVTLNGPGGAHNVAAGAPAIYNGIFETIWDGANTGQITTANVTGDVNQVIAASNALTANAFNAKGTLTTHLNYPDDISVDVRAANLGANSFDPGNFTMLWTTTFTPNVTGTWTFQFQNNDDVASVWVDTSGNSAFEIGERIAVRTACCAGASGTVSVTAGTPYQLAIAMNDTGGGGIFQNMQFAAPASALGALDPSLPANNGRFTVLGVPPASFTDLIVNGPSNTLTSDAGIPSVTVNTLTMNNNGNGSPSLTITPATPGTGFIFSNTSLNGTTNTFTLSNATVTLNNVTGSGGLALGGTGAALLTTSNSYSGTTTIGSGVVARAGNGGALGASGSGNATMVVGGGQLRLDGGTAYTIAEAITINGNGPASNGAIYLQQGGAKTITGQVVTGSSSRIWVDAGASAQLQLNGGLDIGLNHTLTTTRQSGGEIVHIGAPITGSGAWTMDGDGISNVRANSPSYTGAITVSNGILDVANFTDGLGSASAGTMIASGATLRLNSGVNIASENISIAGDGEGGIGAIRSDNNSNQLGGTITMTGNSRIHVNAAQLTLNGQLTQSGGPRNLEKAGAGTLILANASNNYGGTTKISGGTLQANSIAALGGTSAFTLVGTSSLQVSGTATVAAPISVAGTLGTLGNPLAASTTTYTGPLAVALKSNIGFDGAGDTVINSSFGNGNSPVFQNNALAHFGYHINNDGVAMNLNNNAGMMGGTNPANPFNGPSFNGWAYLTNGPSGTGLNFGDDNAFISTGAIGQIDNYSNLFVGILSVSPANAGTWNFRINNQDDPTGIWVDIDGDGLFESNGALNSNQNEQLSWNETGNKTVTLAAGDYMVAFTHREGGGGSNIQARFKSPTMGTEVIVNPADAAQAGLWRSLPIQPTNSVTKSGTGTTTLAATNTYNGTTTVQQGTLVAAANNALGVADGAAATGTSVHNGATLGITSSANIGNEAITLGNGVGGTATLRSSAGNNVAGGNITLAGNGVIDSQTGSSLAIGGGVNLNGTSGGRLTVTGGGETTISGAIAGTNLSSNTITPGLLAGVLAGGNPNTAANPGNLGLVLGPLGGRSDPEHWTTVVGSFTASPDNKTLVYTGQIYLDGGAGPGPAYPTTFVESIDDTTLLIIDGTTVLNNNSWNDTTHSTISRAPGWYDFELRFANGNGGWGPEQQDGWSASFGFGIDVNGNNNDTETNFVFPLDNGTGNLFRQFVAATPNDLHHSGDGILRLNGNNTYVGTTSVGDANGALGTANATTGTLIVNGVTSGQGSYFISSGATLGGGADDQSPTTGVIGLAPGAAIFVSGDPGTISPGDAGPGYSGAFGPTFSQGNDDATVGTLSVDQPSGGLAVDLNGILEIDIVDPETYDVLQAIHGMIDIDGATLQINDATDLLTYDYAAEFGLGPDDVLTFITAQDGITGDFANVPDEEFIDVTGRLALTFTNDGTSFFLSAALAVPEPATIALWSMLGLVGAGFAWRQRRKFCRK